MTVCRPLRPSKMTAEQKKAAEEFSGRARLCAARAVRRDAALARGDAARQGHGGLLTVS